MSDIYSPHTLSMEITSTVNNCNHKQSQIKNFIKKECHPDHTFRVYFKKMLSLTNHLMNTLSFTYVTTVYIIGKHSRADKSNTMVGTSLLL